MSTTARDNLVAWLRDAHGMEEQAEPLLNAQYQRLEHMEIASYRVLIAAAESIGDTRESSRINRDGERTTLVRRRTSFSGGIRVISTRSVRVDGIFNHVVAIADIIKTVRPLRSWTATLKPLVSIVDSARISSRARMRGASAFAWSTSLT